MLGAYVEVAGLMSRSGELMPKPRKDGGDVAWLWAAHGVPGRSPAHGHYGRSLAHVLWSRSPLPLLAAHGHYGRSLRTKKDEEDGSPPQQHMGTSAGVCKPSKTRGIWGGSETAVKAMLSPTSHGHFGLRLQSKQNKKGETAVGTVLS